MERGNIAAVGDDDDDHFAVGVVPTTGGAAEVLFLQCLAAHLIR